MTRRFSIERLESGRLSETIDTLSVEEPLQVLVNGAALATLMRTPGDDIPLVTGFLFSEGLITRSSDIAAIVESPHPGSHEVHVSLSPGHTLPPGMARSVYMSSSCGVCGRTSIRELQERLDPITPYSIDGDLLLSLIERFDASQREFRLTGGVHAAGLFDSTGHLIAMSEDVGRHNALDKVIGRCLREGALPLERTILVMSSRASFDIVQKAAMAGIPVVATMGAASSLAVDLAQSVGIQLFAFLRKHSWTRFRYDQ